MTTAGAARLQENLVGFGEDRALAARDAAHGQRRTVKAKRRRWLREHR
jgi:hypothetical protein